MSAAALRQSLPAFRHSRCSCQLRSGFTDLGIGTDPSGANSWPLRSPGILSRRAPCRFLPPRWQLLDQPSNGCGTLATNSMITVGAKDMPDQSGQLHRWLFSKDFPAFDCNDLAKCRGIVGKIALPVHRQSIKCEEYFALPARLRHRCSHRFPKLPRLGHTLHRL
jgi:hypothetical protein